MEFSTNFYADVNHKISNDDDVVLAKMSPIAILDTGMGRVHKITRKHFPVAIFGAMVEWSFYFVRKSF